MIIALSGPVSAASRVLFTKTPLGDRGTSGIVSTTLFPCVGSPRLLRRRAHSAIVVTLRVPTKVEHCGVDLNGREGWSPAFLTN